MRLPSAQDWEYTKKEIHFKRINLLSTETSATVKKIVPRPRKRCNARVNGARMLNIAQLPSLIILVISCSCGALIKL